MKVFEDTITLDDKKDPSKIIPFSDIHIGAAGVNKVYFKNTIEWIRKTPNTYAIGLGDYCDCIDMKDKRFDIKAVDKSFIKDLDNIAYAEVDWMVKALKPIQNKILCLIPGNHEDKLRTRYSVDVMRTLHDELEVPVGDYMTYFRLKFNKKQFHTSPVNFFLQHGFFAGRKVGGKANQIIDLAGNYEADVYLLGHSHDLFAVTVDKLCLPSSGMTPIKRKKVFINTGTFMETTSKGGTSYSEQKAYPVAKIGTARLDIYPNHRPRPDIHVRI